MVVFWAPVVWALTLLGRRDACAADPAWLAISSAAPPCSVVVAVVLGAIVADDPWSVLRQFADLDGPPGFPPGRADGRRRP